MVIERDVPLSPFTTFNIGGRARYFCRAESHADLREALQFAEKERLKIFILGGGSNVLISDKGFEGIVIKIDILGIEFKEKGRRTEIWVGAGENWDDLVALCVEKGLWGLENLSGIPGTVGGAPVQNIGAYGVEVSDLILHVEAFDRKAGTIKKLKKTACRFKYRDSMFKRAGSPYVITTVVFSLLKDRGRPNLTYPDLKRIFAREGAAKPDQKQVREAVLFIRKGKFPDPAKVGTAGSFFKNPIVSAGVYKKLKAQYPEIPAFKAPSGRVKLSLAWIIDHILHLKGLRLGDAYVSEKQPLVICNQGHATAEDVRSLAENIQRDVRAKIGLLIELEVQCIGIGI